MTLVDENGQERMIRVEDEWLYANGIDEGSPFVEPLNAFCPREC